MEKIVELIRAATSRPQERKEVLKVVHFVHLGYSDDVHTYTAIRYDDKKYDPSEISGLIEDAVDEHFADPRGIIKDGVVELIARYLREAGIEFSFPEFDITYCPVKKILQN
jgi:hypothetical protein